MKFKKNLIIQEANEILDFCKKYKRLPKTCTIGNSNISIYSTAYLLSLLVQDNFKSDSYALASLVKYNTDEHNDKINEKVLKQDYLDMTKRFINYSKKNRRVPSTILTKTSKTKVSFELFTFCLCKIIRFYKENKYLPNYCTFNPSEITNAKTSTVTSKKSSSTSTSTTKKTTNTNSKLFVSLPHYYSSGCNALGQCTPYYCGPHSIHQAIRKFNITKYTEKQIAAWAGTTTSGSSHNGINTAIAKIAILTGIKLKVQWKNFSDMGSTQDERFKNVAKILANKNKAIIWHIGYRNGGNTTTGTIFGHYECIDKINIGTKYVRALNSLGTKKSDGSYTGKLQDRPYKIQSNFAANTPGNQAALCIISKG